MPERLGGVAAAVAAPAIAPPLPSTAAEASTAAPMRIPFFDMACSPLGIIIVDPSFPEAHGGALPVMFVFGKDQGSVMDVPISPWTVFRSARLGSVTAQTGTVVVIEDDPHIADLVDLYLRRDGFRVLLARDGEQGLTFVNQEDPWIVVLDVGLPGQLDGFDVCRRIRAKG